MFFGVVLFLGPVWDAFIMPVSPPLCSCRTLGTPTEATWPGVTKLPDFKETFPKWPSKGLAKTCPKMGADALDLLEVRDSTWRGAGVCRLWTVVMSKAVGKGATASHPLSPYFSCAHFVPYSCLFFLSQKMLAYDPAKRISCRDAMAHPFFDSVDKTLF